MSKIVYRPLAELGHIIPTFGLAERLQSEGHEILYWVEPDYIATVEKRGFACFSHLAELNPIGTKEEWEAYDREETAVQWEKFLPRLWDEYTSGRATEELGRVEPDLVIGDLCCPETSLFAHALGVPFLRASTSFPAYYEVGVPPMWSNALPNEMSHRELELSWLARLGIEREKHIGGSPILSEEAIYRLASRCGVHTSQINWRVAFALYMVDSDPEIVFSSPLLDFPRPPRPSRVYVGARVQGDETATWSFEGRRESSPLVYCSFGSQAVHYEAIPEFLVEFIAMASLRTDIDFVLSLSTDVLADTPLPNHVHRFDWLPQTAILKEADLVICHGGLGTIKESASAGVPLLVYPQAFDQRGNAARVMHHGLGKRLLDRRPKAGPIGDAVDELLSNPKYRQRAMRMKDALEAEEQQTAAVQLVEQLLSTSSNNAKATYTERVASVTRLLFGGE